MAPRRGRRLPHQPPQPPLRQTALVSEPSPLGAGWWHGSLILGVSLAIALGTLALIWLLMKPLVLLVMAVVIAQALSPVVAAIEQWLPRAIAVTLVYLVVLVVLGAVGWAIIPPLVRQATELLPDLPRNSPDLLTDLERWIEQWDPRGGERLIRGIEGLISWVGSALVSLPLAIVSSIFEVVLVLFMSAYWLIAAPSLRRFFLSLFPESRQPAIGSILNDLGQTVGGYVRATVIDGAIVGVIVYFGLRVIGVDFPLILALVAFLGELIPVAGPIIASVPALAVALLDSPRKALVVLVFYVLLQQFESNVLLPNIMHRQAHVPPVLSLFAFFAGATLGGILGAIVATPIAGALRVLTIRLIAPAIRQWTGTTAAPALANTGPPPRPAERGNRGRLRPPRAAARRR